MLTGKKTYIQAAAAAAVVALSMMGYIDGPLANTILQFLGVGIAITLRNAISNMASKDTQANVTLGK